MKLSELYYKELINIVDGARLGYFGEGDLEIDPRTGKILNILLREAPSGFRLLPRQAEYFAIPWSAISRVGDDMIIIDYALPGHRDYMSMEPPTVIRKGK